jgi:hypothetical protein
MSTTNPLTHYLIEAQKLVLAATARDVDKGTALQQLADLLCTPAANHDLAHADDECAAPQVEVAAMLGKWQIALEAGSEAVKALEAANALQAQLVAVLKLQAEDHQRFLPHHAHLCATCIATDAALAAAGAA